MALPPNNDGILVTSGDRPCYPGNYVVNVKPQLDGVNHDWRPEKLSTAPPPPRLSADAA